MEYFQRQIQRAKDLFDAKEHIKALEVLEDLSYVEGYDYDVQGLLLKHVQGKTLKKLGEEAENPNIRFTYLLASAECFLTNRSLLTFAATSLSTIAQQLGSVLYYMETLSTASDALDVIWSDLLQRNLEVNETKHLDEMISNADSRIAQLKTSVLCPWKSCEQTLGESKENEETRMNDSPHLFDAFRTYWAGLNLESKKNFMQVSIAELTSYVQRLYGTEGRDALEQVLTFAKDYKKWRFWLCRKCSSKFLTSEECKNHLEEEHVAQHYPLPQRISKAWGRKITSGGWKPVDAVTAIDMIKNRLEYVKAFAYENGWSKDWPLAADEERSKLLQDIQLLLVSFWDLKILSCSIRDRVMYFVVNHFESFEVSKHTLTDCRLVETPQSICFLEWGELDKILKFLKNVKCVRADGTDLVSKAVDSFCSGTRVKEKIEFDRDFSFLLLDKRLMQCEIARFDDEGTIRVFSPNEYYAKAHAQGDVILCWLVKYSSGEESLRFPRLIRAHNLDIWLAVLSTVQFMCRNLESKHEKKLQMLDYDAALTEVKNLCNSEDEKRRNLQEYQPNRYAALLYDRCEQRCNENPLYKGLFLNVLQDVLCEEWYPAFYFDLEEWQNFQLEPQHPSDDIVLKSIDHLKLMVTDKVSLIDSKILLIENSRMNLLNELTRISVFDYRSYILRLLKEFLLDGSIDMETKAKSAATEADLFPEKEKASQLKKKKNKCSKEELERIEDMDASTKSAEAILLSKKKQEKKKKSGSKMKKHRSNKRTSTSMSSLLDQNVKHESSVNLESGITPPSLKTVEEESMELEDILSSERDQLEISTNTDNQEEAAKDMQSMPGEDLSKQLESENGAAATRCYLALEMTLKALCNIKALEEDLMHNRQQFPEILEQGFSFALRNFFVAFCSEEIKEEGVDRYLLSELRGSLEGVCSMSSDAVELLVAILEFWPCWKSPERENLVDCLFLLEEYEIISCSKCRRKPNYSEQSSYGIVMAADSVRDLKCAFGNIKFEDILKVICMDYKMVCDIRTGGCGKAYFVDHTISRRPPIFTMVLKWEKDETEKEISDTTKALDWEIDMSRLYKGLDPNTKYRLVSMIGCGGEEEYICLAYKKNRWVSFIHGSLAKEAVVGNWTNVVRFCGERKVRPEILFYEALQWPSK